MHVLHWKSAMIVSEWGDDMPQHKNANPVDELCLAKKTVKLFQNYSFLALLLVQPSSQPIHIDLLP